MQDWEKIAGKNVASNCTPLSIKNGILVIGANHPQWRQALFYNRLKLIESLNSADYKVKDIRIKQYYPQQIKEQVSEKNIWESHPSRTDIHGISDCECCGNPAPLGEIQLWGKCGFCRRKDF